MSHFTVLVIGENPERQLAPYHEFECTGEDDEFVQDVDITADARKEYEEDTDRLIRDRLGNLHSAYDDLFYRDPTPEERAKIGPIAGSGGGHGMSWTSKDWGDGLGYRTKVRHVPEDCEEVEVPTAERRTFAEFVHDWYGYEAVGPGEEPDLGKRHKYGYCRLDENGEVARVIDRTNPNKKWDWYQLGGRWTGFFQLKPTAARVAVGSPGLMTEVAAPGTADQARKGDIDFNTMRLLKEAEAGERWDQAHEAAEGKPWKTWEQVRAEFGDTDAEADLMKRGERIDQARDAYWAQPQVRAIRDKLGCFDVDDYAVPREAYTENARRGAISTFAVLKDGQWYERGEMGWWGAVHDEKDRAVWLEQFEALLDGLPDDTLLSVYDCHI